MRASAVVWTISILHLMSANAVPDSDAKDGPPGSARIGKGDPPADAAAVAAAERAFAKLAEEKGVRDAFVATAAEDGILLRPGPVNAREFMSKRPSNTAPLLAWGPSYVEVSASGDLAWDTGPWSFRPDRAKPPVAWGHFATVWRKDADGAWRWIIDHGHDMPEAGPDEGFAWGRASDGTSKSAQTPAAKDGSTPASAALTAADRAYEEALASGGLPLALEKFGAPDVRVYREGKAPATGAAARMRLFPDEWRGGLKSSEPHTGTVSRAGDLGFTYGTIVLADTSVSRHGRNYVRIWRNDGRSGWRVALDVVNEIPPPPPPPAAEAPAAPPPAAPPPAPAPAPK